MSFLNYFSKEPLFDRLTRQSESTTERLERERVQREKDEKGNRERKEEEQRMANERRTKQVPALANLLLTRVVQLMDEHSKTNGEKKLEVNLACELLDPKLDSFPPTDLQKAFSKAIEGSEEITATKEEYNYLAEAVRAAFEPQGIRVRVLNANSFLDTCVELDWTERLPVLEKEAVAADEERKE